MTPEALRMRVIEALWSETELEAGGIRVFVIGNDVYLEGTVPTPAMYDLAEHVASTVRGVGDLTNSLTTTEEPYDLAAHREGMDLRMQPTTDVNEDGRLETRIGPFGAEWDEAMLPEGQALGGPVGGDDGDVIHPTDLHEVAPLASDIVGAEEPWRYGIVGPNAHIDPEPVLPPDEDEV